MSTETISAAIRRLRVAATAFDAPEAPSFGPPCSTADLANLASSIPEELVSLLAVHRAIVAMEIHNGYWIGGSATGPFRLPEQPRRAELGAGSAEVVVIATDGGGNAFVQARAGGPVWRWDHETCRTHLVAPTLADFLDAVAADWTHYAAGDDWPFLMADTRYPVPRGSE